MKIKWMKFLLTLVLSIIIILPAFAEVHEEPVEGWPRLIADNNDQLVIYQPQINEWDNYQHISIVAAINLKGEGTTEDNYGAVYAEADTEINFDTRMVLMKNIQLTRIHFPNSNGDEERLGFKIRNMIQYKDQFPISLDRVLAALERSKIQKRTVEVNLAPPPIFYSDTEAIQVIFLGDPKFEPLKDSSLLFAVNTNWDIFLEIGTSTYYMLNDTYWMKTKDLFKGPWEPAGSLPSDLLKLPADENWSNIKKNMPGQRVSKIPKVFVSDQPSELIVTKGKPLSTLIAGTQLLYVTNTTNDLFLHFGQGQYYFLTAGRWFRAKTLEGPWELASTDLPDDFIKISTNHVKAHVLASVPGTSESEAAVLLASIPQKASVDRNSTMVEVAYEKEPEFVTIEGTSLYYAVNTPYSVFRVDNRYYLCHQGVWFYSHSPKGKWVVAASVPSVIYTIPSTHPKYNVTYVYVYSSTPSTVVVGYTSGYSGSYVAATGVLMFGLGYWIGHDDDWHHHHHYHYHSHYYSYGSAARYNYNHGGYYRSASHYGPYGGAGRGAAYNPRTGTYARGAYRYGPKGAAFAAQAYNPYTDRYAARAGAGNAYGSWGKSVVGEGDKWARAGHRSNWKGTVAGYETSKGTAGIVGKNKLTGNKIIAGKNRYGDVYVGRDGNVYKREDRGSWTKNSNGRWESVQTDRIKKSSTQSKYSRKNQSSRNVSRQLNDNFRSRSIGNSRTRNFQQSNTRRQSSSRQRRR